MEHVMLDIETLGKGRNAVILSIGACYFNPKTGEIGSTFHEHIDVEDAVAKGLKMDAPTVLWWLSQERQAQSKITDGQKKSKPLGAVLKHFGNFLDWDTRVWGNGIAFDNVLVADAYSVFKRSAPWAFWNDRDVRTLVELGQEIGIDPKKDMPFQGVKHDALSDAIHQAKYVSVIWQKLTIKE